MIIDFKIEVSSKKAHNMSPVTLVSREGTFDALGIDWLDSSCGIFVHSPFVLKFHPWYGHSMQFVSGFTYK
jgi:hypothetical protein